jgi:hypothetical protein
MEKPMQLVHYKLTFNSIFLCIFNKKKLYKIHMAWWENIT